MKGVFLIGKKIWSAIMISCIFYRVNNCNFTNNESATILTCSACTSALCRSTQMSRQENWCHMATSTWVNIGSDNGLLPNVTKPLSETTFRQRFCVAFSREQFHPTCHYDDVIMTTIASQITSLTVVYSIVHSDADERKHPVNSPHKGPVTRKMFPFYVVIMSCT